jgi:hypothetical protein
LPGDAHALRGRLLFDRDQVRLVLFVRDFPVIQGLLLGSASKDGDAPR